MATAAMITAAAARLSGHAIRTPLLSSPFLDELAGRRVFVKPECLQKTGSFKFRGGWSAVSALAAKGSSKCLGAGGAMGADIVCYCPARHWGRRRRGVGLTKWLFETVFMAALRTDSCRAHSPRPTVKQ